MSAHTSMRMHINTHQLLYAISVVETVAVIRVVEKNAV